MKNSKDYHNVLEVRDTNATTVDIAGVQPTPGNSGLRMEELVTWKIPQMQFPGVTRSRTMSPVCLLTLSTPKTWLWPLELC